MNTQYLIEDATLTNIAEAIRIQTNETEPIRTVDFANKISNIDLPTVMYMQLYDLPDAVNGVRRLWDFNYSEEEVAKVDNLITILGGEING